MNQHGYAYVLSHPARLSQSPGLSSLSHTANSHGLSALYMAVYASMLLSPFIALPPSPTVFSVPERFCLVHVVHEDFEKGKKNVPDAK